MRIAIIGAGIAGLTAARELARTGNEVTVLEKSRGIGGRLATRYAGPGNKSNMDHGTPYFTARSSEFSGFVSELLEENIVKLWGDKLWHFDGNKIIRVSPHDTVKTKFAAVEGMNRIGKYLSRWADVHTGVKAGGLTYIGDNRRNKRAWMVNLINYSTFEADAVIIAIPAPQAYAMLLTTQDEVNTLKMIREIDEINYESVFSLMAGYGSADIPEWDGLSCQDQVLQFISNENSKRDQNPDVSLVVHSTPSFARENRERPVEEVKKKMIDRLAEVTGDWAAQPDWSDLHFWRFAKPRDVIQRPYMEFETINAPLALVGDYFKGNSVEHAYQSGLRLAKAWIEKYRD